MAYVSSKAEYSQSIFLNLPLKAPLRRTLRYISNVTCGVKKMRLTLAFAARRVQREAILFAVHFLAA